MSGGGFERKIAPMGGAEMAWDELLTIMAARGALVLYTATLLVQSRRNRARRESHSARVLWSLGCLLLVVHEAAALYVFHDGSQLAAWRHTAQRTAEVTGWQWGGGLVINYVFAALWVADATWWWVSPARRAAARRWHIVLQSIFAFMFLNAAIVFAPPAGRLWGVGCMLMVLAVSIRNYWSTRRGRSRSEGLSEGAESVAQS